MGLIQGTPTGRGKQHDIAGIGALWADVDFAGEAHADKALPTGEDDFQRLLIELPMQPSLIVDSGHGRHLYWLLQLPWIFTDADERNRAASLAKAWHGLVCIRKESVRDALRKRAHIDHRWDACRHVAAAVKYSGVRNWAQEYARQLAILVEELERWISTPDSKDKGRK